MNSEDITKSYKRSLILIILLLLFLISCFIIGYKLGKINTPKYNVDPDIFEINGELNSNISNKDNTGDTNNPINEDNNTNDNINNYNSNQSNISGNNSIVIDNNDNTSSNITFEKDKDFTVSDNNVNWNSTEKIDIFKNSYFNNQNKIAPGISSTYNFVVKNNTDYTLSYQIKITEINNYNINMKYRLKKNNEYIIGANDIWVYPSEIILTDQIIKSSNNDTYTLEWKWFDSDNDSKIGKLDSANYSLSITISAEDYEA